MNERRKKRRAWLLALFSTGLLTLFFLLLVQTPPVPPRKATGYLLVEFGPGGQNLPPPPAPRPPERPVPQAAKPEPKAKAPPKPKARPKPASRPTPKPAAPKKPAPPAKAPAAPRVSKPEAPAPRPKVAPTPTVPEGPPLVPEVPQAERPAPKEAPPAPPSPAAEVPAPTTAPAPAPPPSPAPGPPEVAEPPPGFLGEAPEAPAPALPPAPPAAAPEESAPLPAPELPRLAEGPAPPTPQPGPLEGGAKGPGASHYEVRLAVPLLVSVDNAHAAFPQKGFALARRVYEVPVEGGVTRLLFETRGGETGLVGPVRSARLYMLELADALEAFLVHVGGSPLAQKQIEEGGYVTFDGLFDRRRFVRTKDRRPPHNAYADLGRVRAELRRLGLDRFEVKKGAAFLPPKGAAPGELVRVRFAPDYQTAFRYQEGAYRWLRNGAPTPVRVDAVAVLFVKARVRDRVGRLDLRLSEGEGALYLKGRYLPVRWRLGVGGFTLTDAEGRALDLTPYRVWFVLVPPWARVE